MQRLQTASELNGQSNGATHLAARCARDLLDSLPPVMWFMRKHMRKHRKGLSMPQFRALVRIDRQPHTSVSELAEHLAVSVPTASRVLAGLVDRKLLERKTNGRDRRVVAVQITTTGRSTLESARNATRKQMATALSALSDDQLRDIANATTALRQIFGSIGEGPVTEPLAMAGSNGGK
jgi:DNA-binding MarR family transcriptional regulator